WPKRATPGGLTQRSCSRFPLCRRGEAIIEHLGAVRITLKPRPMKRAAFLTAWRTKHLRACACVLALCTATPPRECRNLWSVAGHTPMELSRHRYVIRTAGGRGRPE